MAKVIFAAETIAWQLKKTALSKPKHCTQDRETGTFKKRVFLLMAPGGWVVLASWFCAPAYQRPGFRGRRLVGRIKPRKRLALPAAG